MLFDIITIFPEIFDSYLNESILKRAQKNKKIKIKIHNLRDFTKDKHKKVDDRPFGGGPGMVLKAEPIIKAVLALKPAKKTKIILFTPGGKQFDEKTAQKLSKEAQLIIICGRYEGIDERVSKILKANSYKLETISIGPYVLTGGELPAMVLIDSISRKIPGVLGKEESLEENRLGIGVPAYTRPAKFKYKGKKYKVPEVLLSGNHAEIKKWRKSRI
ncbi:tRNA (guanosine(37)-N1)-methyltransferase TrmD [Candidatus Wolfebacteria bacterium]|nr:tRNA (guanosine(37)-N1)-methyltransferase TrmD [Candidatus Wolfebacteria bacterium]